MKITASITALILALLSSGAWAQEMTPERERILEIVESGRGVLLPLNGALAPLPGTEPEEAELATGEQFSDPLLDPPEGSDESEMTEKSVLLIPPVTETEVVEEAGETEEPEPAEVVAEEAGIEEVVPEEPAVEEEVVAVIPTPPAEPEAPGDLAMPLQVASVELGDPESIGPYRLWLASYRNKSEAQAGWEQLVKENPQVLANLVPVLVLKELGEAGETFFRLQAGPLQSEAEAVAACKSLQDMRLYCTVLGP